MGNSPEDVANQVDALIGECMEIDQPTLLAIGHAAQAVILLRTKKGLDADRRKFKPYTEAYAKKKAASGRSPSTVDLAVTGHMQGATIVKVYPGEVAVEFMADHEALKGAVHNNGVDKHVSVRVHRRTTYVNSKNGQRVSAKNKRGKHVVSRVENVTSFTRHQRTPKREWFDVRHSVDVRIVEQAAGDAMEARAAKVLK